jgi:rhodanese-related sulfurtransferase
MTVVDEISVQELAELKEQGADFLLLDVREPSEYDAYNLGGRLIPLGQLADRILELDPNQLIVVHCKSGGRSRRAAEFLLQSGFTQVKNLTGGATAWQAANL